jgi:hypothetical protein
MGYRLVERGKYPEHNKIQKVGLGLTIAGFALTSCTAELDAAISPTQVFPTEPIPTEVMPTATRYAPVIDGLSPEEAQIRAAFGGPVGAGGPIIRFERISNSSFIQRRLNSEGLAPVVNGNNVLTQIGYQPDGKRVCVPNVPSILFNPNVESGQDDWISANNLVVSYGDINSGQVRFKGLGAITLRETVENVVCVNAVINDQSNSFNERLGKVLNVLLDRDTGEIYGTLPAIYAENDNVEFDPETSEVRVNNEVVWFVGVNIQELSDMVPDNREILASSDAGYLGRLLVSFEDLPEDLTDTIPSEITESQRFVLATGEKIPFGYYKDEIVRDNGKALVLFHLQMRGEVESTNKTVRMFLFSFPLEEVNTATGQLEATGQHQFLLLGVPDQVVGGTKITGYNNRNIESSTVNNSTWKGAIATLQGVPEGASVMVGVWMYNPNSNGFDEVNREVVSEFINGELSDSKFGLGTLDRFGLDKSLLGY